MTTIFTEVFQKLKSPITLVAWVTATVVCTFTEPFGTDYFGGLHGQAFFWGCIIFTGITYCLLCLHIMFHAYPKLRPAYQKIIAISFFTVTFTNLISWMLEMVYMPVESPTVTQIYVLIGTVAFSVSAAIYWLHIRPAKQRKKAQEAFAAPLVIPKEPFSPPALEPLRLAHPILSKFAHDANIIRLNMRDHYVEVFSDQGTELIHMRFSEAVDALTDLNGMQVHRSHWVNLSNIKDVINTKGRAFFIMSDGAQVPISRSKQKMLRETGIL